MTDYLVVAGAGVLLWFCFFWIVSPSERFNALLIPLWILNFALGTRKIEKKALIVGIGVGIGVLGFHVMGTVQALMLGARMPWWEPLQKTVLTAGLFILYGLLCDALNGVIALVPAARPHLTSPRGWWLTTLRAGVALCLFAPYLYVSFNIHRFKYASSSDPLTRCHLPFQKVHFKARDGNGLNGWFILSSGSDKTIIGVHGVGSNRGDLLGIVPFLHRAGYNRPLAKVKGGDLRWPQGC